MLPALFSSSEPDTKCAVVRQAFQRVEGYCPKWAFHAIDEFMMLSPTWADGSYSYSGPDEAFGEQVRTHFVEFATVGSVSSWPSFTRAGSAPLSSRAVELASSPDPAAVMGLVQRVCDVWITVPAVERIALINRMRR